MALLRPQTILSTIFLALILTARPIASQNPNTPNQVSDPKVAEGRVIFSTYCSGCHGLDASGTQRAPNLAAGSGLDRLTPQEIRRIISNGVPAAGMPAFHAFGEARLSSILAYLDYLGGKKPSSTLSGDPEKGEQLFFGSAGCSSCHAIGGKGGFIAPDLTTYGSHHSPEQIKLAITDPAGRDSSFTVVTVTTHSGETTRGVVRNEDNFSIQVQSFDGSFHFFSKSALERIERQQQSFMPSDYSQTLDAKQIDDLIRYLLNVGSRSRSATAKEDNED